MSYSEIKINNLEQINELLWKQNHDKAIDRFRASTIYRGLPNVHYHLATSLHRNCIDKSIKVEESLLRNFAKYASIEDESINNSIWKQLVLGQHHGLPTRLLDWTYSVLVALHFATSNEDLSSLDKNDAVVWEIDINEMNLKLPAKYQQVLSDSRAFLMTIDMLESLSEEKGFDAIKKYDLDMKSKSAMVLLEPPSLDQRIISQYSYFSIIPSNMENRTDDLGIENFLKNTDQTKKYIIDKQLKWRIRDMLDQMNINERTIYPGLDGLTQWLKRHYYVKR